VLCQVDGSADPDTTSAVNLDLDAGETITCTFTNTKQATVRVDKIAIGGNATFIYDVGGQLNGLGSPAVPDPLNILTGGGVGSSGTFTFSNLPAAGQSLIFDEGALAGWDFTLLQVSGDAGFGIVGDIATLDVDPGETIVVTYTNTKRAVIIIEKLSRSGTTPPACTTFPFDGVGGAGGIPNFSLDTCTGSAEGTDGFLKSTSPLYEVIPSVARDVREILPSSPADPNFGWGLDNISCTTNGATIAIGTGGADGGAFDATGAGYQNGDTTVRVNPAPGSLTTCRFTNTQAVMPLIKLFSNRVPNCTFDNPITITGAAASGGAFSPIRITVGSTATLLDGQVVIIDGVTGTIAPFVNGQWFVDVIDPTHFDLVSSKFFGGTYTSGGTATEVTGCTDSGGTLGPVPFFEFRLFLDPAPGAPVAGFADGHLASVVVPPAADLPGLTGIPFTICEMNPGVGGNGYKLSDVVINIWNFGSDLSGDPDSSTTPVLYEVNDGGANVGICFDGFIDPGTAKYELNANNTKPAGTRTIGYWANWTTCDGTGNQEAVAAQNGGSGAGFWLLDDVLSILDVGLADPLTCKDAVDLLKKRDKLLPNELSGGRDGRANDAAYALAAQLIAAEANYEAGALQCTEATDAINQAQDLLDAIGFTGTGAFLSPRPGISLTNYNAVRNYALGLASVLDAYNNLHDVGTCASVPAAPDVVVPAP
jgi:hypothetical protein